MNPAGESVQGDSQIIMQTEIQSESLNIPSDKFSCQNAP